MIDIDIIFSHHGIGEAHGISLFSCLMHRPRENPARLKPNIDTRRAGIETFVAHTSSGVEIAGYDYLISYASESQCDYQARLRSSRKVGQHYTGLFSSTTVER